MKKETPEQYMRRIIYERVLQLLKKQETGNYNGATIPAFKMGLDADIEELIKIGKQEAQAEFEKDMIEQQGTCFENGYAKGKAQAEREYDKIICDKMDEYFKLGKAQALAEVMKIIDEFKMNGDKYILCGSKSSPILLDGRLKEELKAKLQSPNKSDAPTLFGNNSGDITNHNSSEVNNSKTIPSEELRGTKINTQGVQSLNTSFPSCTRNLRGARSSGCWCCSGSIPEPLNLFMVEVGL